VGVTTGDGKCVEVAVGGNQIIVGVMVAVGGDCVSVGIGVDIGVTEQPQHKIPNMQ